MPVSHIGLTVAHLPTSCSFFLAALAPLGYRYFGQEGNQIAFGIDDADFFISQETSSIKAGAAHVAFVAPSQKAVLGFFTAALKAGGRIHGEPAIRDPESGYYSAAVLDLDNNSIEVRYREGVKVDTSRSMTREMEKGSVLSWQKDVARSTVSNFPLAKSASSRVHINNIAAPTVVISQPTPDPKPRSDLSTKAFIGTLLGAAAGAAVAYAMSKAEEESDRAAATRTVTYQSVGAPPLQPNPSAISPPESYVRSMSYPTQRPIIQQIEYPHHPPSIAERSTNVNYNPFIEDRPASQVAPASVHLGTLIDTFIPPSEVARYQPRAITRSHTDSILQPSRSHALSTVSRPAQASRAVSAANTVTPVNLPLSPRSVVTEVRVARDLPLPNSRAPSILRDEGDRYSPSFLGSVAPSDSVSQAGSKKSHGSRKSKRHSSPSGKSRRSKASNSHVSEQTVRGA